jgi:hypothetical protein
MTRAIVRLIGDKEGTIRLYRSSDGGICNGLGEDLFEFCESYKGKTSVGEVLKVLILNNEKLGLALSGENTAVDYVYDLVVEYGISLALICHKVDWVHDKMLGIEDRLSPPVDIEDELRRYKMNVREKLYKCPFCGESPSKVYSANNGNTVCCDNYSCDGHSLISWCENMRSAEIEWNKACERIMRGGNNDQE